MPFIGLGTWKVRLNIFYLKLDYRRFLRWMDVLISSLFLSVLLTFVCFYTVYGLWWRSTDSGFYKAEVILRLH